MTWSRLPLTVRLPLTTTKLLADRSQPTRQQSSTTWTCWRQCKHACSADCVSLLALLFDACRLYSNTGDAGLTDVAMWVRQRQITLPVSGLLSSSVLHNTICCQYGLTTGWTTGCIVYTNVQPVVNPVVQPVWQPAVSCIRSITVLWRVALESFWDGEWVDTCHTSSRD